MYKASEIMLAEKILQLDKQRDELYEELAKTLGPSAFELIRMIQNKVS
jgi:hypothetical protein